MKIRPGTKLDERRVQDCINTLRGALVIAKSANCPKLSAKIRRAIKSAGGAMRHVRHRIWRAEDAG